MVNRGEEKVRVHMNVVPRSTKNTNGGTNEFDFQATRGFSSLFSWRYSFIVADTNQLVIN